jgi:putative Holliday junction resolvase
MRVMPENGSATTPVTILAFDFGQRRIGIAVGQTITGSASPLGVALNGDHGPDFQCIAAHIREWRPDRLVLGLPLHADGSDSDMGDQARAFGKLLERYGVPVELVDERHTSQEASALLATARQKGSRGRIRKARIDAAAAVLIAERYLQSADPGK